MDRITSRRMDSAVLMARDGVAALPGGGSTGRWGSGSDHSRMRRSWIVGQAEGLRRDERDEWERFTPAWHAGFAGLALLTVVLIAADDKLGGNRRYLGF